MKAKSKVLTTGPVYLIPVPNAMFGNTIYVNGFSKIMLGDRQLGVLILEHNMTQMFLIRKCFKREVGSGRWMKCLFPLALTAEQALPHINEYIKFYGLIDES
jgi:hypothetical protein